MKIETLNLKDTNCYLISSENAAIVIDPGYKSDIPEKFLKENCDKEGLILLTHAHFDHIGDAERLRDICNVKIAIGKYDNPALSDSVINEGEGFGIYVNPFSADILLNDDETFYVGDLKIKTIRAKGHTVGGVCYLINDVLFSGDILFRHGFGNTCFHGGSRRGIFESLNMLFNSFSLQTAVYPGHGETTTIGDEKKYYGR